MDFLQLFLQFSTNDNGFPSISNLDFANGYDAFSTCAFSINIPSGYEAIIDISQFWLEAGVDKLMVVKGNQMFELKNGGSYKIKSDLDESTFKFIADGNIRQAGFNASYNIISKNLKINENLF
uniref:CUB domain-containing protein n=1 Tax=Panagrolaimus superbus TaxID=310955 RepID=A0A914YDN8_9BILA